MKVDQKNVWKMVVVFAISSSDFFYLLLGLISISNKQEPTTSVCWSISYRHNSQFNFSFRTWFFVSLL